MRYNTESITPKTPGQSLRADASCKIIPLERARTLQNAGHSSWADILHALKSENELLLSMMEKTLNERCPPP